MRKTDKDRAIKKKQRLEIKAKKLACSHPRRTAQGSGNECKLVCLECGETIVMAGVGVFGKGLDPQAKRNEAHKRHG